MATSRALELTECPYHGGMVSEVIERVDGLALANWTGWPGLPDHDYLIALCATGHSFARDAEPTVAFA